MLTEGNDESDSQNEGDLPEKYIQLFSIKLADFHGHKIVSDVLDTDEETPIAISTSHSIVVVWDAKVGVIYPKECHHASNIPTYLRPSKCSSLKNR